MRAGRLPSSGRNQDEHQRIATLSLLRTQHYPKVLRP